MLSSYIQETTKPGMASYILGDSVPYSVECVNSEYNVRVTINGTIMGVTDISTRTLSFIDDGENDNRYNHP